MKKLLSVLAVGLGCALCAGSLNIDGQFKKLKADGLPLYWIIKSSSNPACGKFKLVESAEGRSIDIAASAVMAAAFYTVESFPVTAGKKLYVSANVKGIGKCAVVVYVYDPSGAWICSLPLAELEASDKVRKIAGELEIPAFYPVRQKGELVDKQTGKFRIALQVPQGGKAVFSDVQAELK